MPNEFSVEKFDILLGEIGNLETRLEKAIAEQRTVISGTTPITVIDGQNSSVMAAQTQVFAAFEAARKQYDGRVNQLVDYLENATRPTLDVKISHTGDNYIVNLTSSQFQQHPKGTLLLVYMVRTLQLLSEGRVRALKEAAKLSSEITKEHSFSLDGALTLGPSGAQGVLALSNSGLSQDEYVHIVDSLHGSAKRVGLKLEYTYERKQPQPVEMIAGL